MPSAPAPFPVAADLRGILEYVAERLDVGAGEWRVELHFSDGRLRRMFRHDGPIKASVVDERFGPVSAS